MATNEISVDLVKKDISHELWREYEFIDPDTKQVRVYRIDKPIDLYYRIGGTTHRIVDSNGVAHCPPAPGHFGCVLRWQNPPDDKPVHF